MQDEVAVINVSVTNFFTPFPWYDENSNPGFVKSGFNQDNVRAQLTAATAHVTQGTAESPTNIKVTGPVTLKFRITTPLLYPIGIGFRTGDLGASSDPQSTPKAIGAVPRESIVFGQDDAGYWVQFDDLHVDNTHWKYYIIAQDSYGNIGVIDPEIEDDPS